MYERFVTKEAFTLIGTEWKGTFSAAANGEIRKQINDFRERMHEIDHVVNPETLIGYSKDHDEVGFTHYIGLQVSKADTVPEGMVAVDVPTKLYAVCAHEKGQEILSTYDNLNRWYESMGYEKDDCGFWFETYRSTYDPMVEEAEFWVYMPVRKK